MNSSNTNPSSRQQGGGAGFRSGPIRNVGGGPPPISSGWAVNRTSSTVGPGHQHGGSHLGPNRSSTSARPNTAPSLVAAPPPVLPSAARHPYDAKPVQQQQQVSYNTSNVGAPSTPSRETTFTPDNSAQLQPHIVSLPPSPTPPQPPLSQLQQTTAAPTFQHPLQPSSSSSMQQQHAAQGLYQARSSDHPAAELQRRFYPQHYNNQQQQQQVVSSNVVHQQPTLQNQQQPSQTSSYQVKSTPTVTTTTAQQQQQQLLQISSTIYHQTQTQPPPIQRNKQPHQPPSTQPPPTPDEDLDNFLSTGLTDSASGMTYTRPKPLPHTTSVLSKCKLLAQRRAWGDVIRVTNDALIVRNMDGSSSGGGGGTSDVGKHHSYYSEIVACATSSGPNSPSKKKPSSSSSHAAAATASSPNEIDEIQKLRRETCELIVLRFMAHLKLRRYVDLGKEVSMLGLMPFLPDRRGVVEDGCSSLVDDLVDNDDITNDNINNYNNHSIVDNYNTNDTPLSWKEGSIHSTELKDKLPPWIPYGLRILAAQQLQYNDGSSKALDVLLDMRDRVVRTEYWNTGGGVGGMECWKSTIDNAIVNACVSMKEWRLALYHLEELIHGLEEGVDREVHWWCRQDSLMGSIGEETRSELRELITSAAYVELLSRQILVLLQSGAIKAAEMVQGDVRLHASKVEGIVFTGALSRIHREFALVRQTPVREMVNDGLILFAQSDYEMAATRFRGAMELQQKITTAAADNNNNNNDLSTLHNTDAAAPSSPPGCPSWKDLDSPTLGFDADPSLTVECINNLSLCLLYTGNMRRKKRLQRVAKRFFLHDIGVESFRLN